jgi:cis-3-alkyl-4-acyloxetan-2-one decarboxylase
MKATGARSYCCTDSQPGATYIEISSRRWRQRIGSWFPTIWVSAKATPDREYTLRTHVGNLTALIDALDLRDITLVMQDWGGPIGVGYAVRHPQRIHSLVLMNTVVGYGTAGRRDLLNPLETPWFRWVRDGLPTGRTEAVLSQLGSTILSVLQIVGLERLDRVNPTLIRAYGTPFPTPTDCKGAIEFPLDLALGRIRDFVREGIGGLPALREKPALMIEGCWTVRSRPL